jgi:hypothetical protein
LKYKDEDLQFAVTEALKAMAPLDRQSLPYIVSPIYDDLSRRAELRFLAHLLSGGDEEVELLLRWLGRPDRYPEDPLSHGFGVKTLEVFAKVWPAGTALPGWRDELEKQIAKVASRVQWTPADLPLLRRHATNLENVRSTQVASVRNIIASIEGWQWIRARLPIFFGGIILYVALLLLTFWRRPLWLYKANNVLQSMDFTLPAQIGGMKVGLRYLLLAGFFHYNRRVLDAWVAKYIAAAREEFQKKETVQDRQVHIPVPVVLDGQSIPQLESRHLQPVFSKKRGCLLIWGEGGAGKTSLACQIANWAMSDDPAIRLCGQHAMLPVLIEHELDMKIAADKHLFTEAIRGELRAVINAEKPIPEALLLHLLKQRRILVIVDHFSEMSEATRKEIRPGHPDFPANALIITSRINERLDGVPKTALKPLRIQSDRLSSFMHDYLMQRGKRDLFDDPEFFEACRQLSIIVGTREITVLLAKLYAEQLITVKEGIDDVNLPENIPDLMLSYVNEVNRGIGGVGESRPDDRTVHRVAKATAWECLKGTYRPTPARRDNILAALASENNAETLLKYMEDRLRLIQTVGTGRDQMRFALDPLAEYLAGFYLVEHYGESEQGWREFIMQSDTMPGAPEAIRGFLLAVRDCCVAKGSSAGVPEFVAVELARRVSSESQEQMSAR